MWICHLGPPLTGDELRHALGWSRIRVVGCRLRQCSFNRDTTSLVSRTCSCRREGLYRFTGPTSPTFFSLIIIDYVLFITTLPTRVRELLACFRQGMKHILPPIRGARKRYPHHRRHPRLPNRVPQTPQRLDYQQRSN